MTECCPLPAEPAVRHRFVQTDRVRLHVAETGEGPPVLLLHGWLQHWWAWRRVLPTLAPRHRVICMDLRGFGWSDAPKHGYRTADLAQDVLSLLDALDVDRTIVVGHDVGGRVGFQVALQAPERVGGLVTLNALHPFWRFRSVAPHAWRYGWTPAVETSGVGRLLLRRAPALTRIIFRLGHARGVLTAEEVAQYESAVRRPEYARAAERVMHEVAYHEVLPSLFGAQRGKRLTVPTLMLHGTRDLTRTAGSLGGFEGRADDLRVRILDGAGHWLPEERPEDVATAVHEVSALSLA
ncbi:MAG TPA: alpha/beta hydrolase [Jatrophihabitantaceae bacterium]|nr:alpha/beta hydrolase [Jatrophihabitantaceae bacterium]